MDRDPRDLTVSSTRATDHEAEIGFDMMDHRRAACEFPTPALDPSARIVYNTVATSSAYKIDTCRSPPERRDTSRGTP